MRGRGAGTARANANISGGSIPLTRSGFQIIVTTRSETQTEACASRGFPAGPENHGIETAPSGTVWVG